MTKTTPADQRPLSDRLAALGYKHRRPGDDGHYSRREIIAASGAVIGLFDYREAADFCTYREEGSSEPDALKMALMGRTIWNFRTACEAVDRMRRAGFSWPEMLALSARPVAREALRQITSGLRPGVRTFKGEDGWVAFSDEAGSTAFAKGETEFKAVEALIAEMGKQDAA